MIVDRFWQGIEDMQLRECVEKHLASLPEFDVRVRKSRVLEAKSDRLQQRLAEQPEFELCESTEGRRRGRGEATVDDESVPSQCAVEHRQADSAVLGRLQAEGRREVGCKDVW